MRCLLWAEGWRVTLPKTLKRGSCRAFWGGSPATPSIHGDSLLRGDDREAGVGFVEQP
jgi:hypothetical protein